MIYWHVCLRSGLVCITAASIRIRQICPWWYSLATSTLCGRWSVVGVDTNWGCPSLIGSLINGGVDWPRRKILNYVFAHRKDDEEIFPLTVDEVALAQKKDRSIQKDKQAYERKLVENNLCCARMDGLSSLPNFNIGQ